MRRTFTVATAAAATAKPTTALAGWCCSTISH
jgi:hypothetical protein